MVVDLVVFSQRCRLCSRGENADAHLCSFSRFVLLVSTVAVCHWASAPFTVAVARKGSKWSPLLLLRWASCQPLLEVHVLFCPDVQTW